MGAFYDISCPVCDAPTEPVQPDPFDFPSYFPSGTRLGCGLRYPEVCESIYHDIRKGKYGAEAKKAMRWMIRPAIYSCISVYVCGDCGRWQPGEEVKICRLKKGRTENPGSSLDRERQARVKANMKALCYLDEKEYDVVWENKYPCNRCGGETTIRDVRQLRCHRCGGPMTAKCTGHWD